MEDSRLADVVIQRLNSLLEDPAVCKDLSALLRQEVLIGSETVDHPTLQVRRNLSGAYVLTALGLLNGLVGALTEGSKAGWGYITAVFDDSGCLCEFIRTDKVGLRG